MESKQIHNFIRHYFAMYVIFCFGLLNLAIVPAFGEEIEYECSPSGVISVTNPNPAVYIGAHANTSDASCPTTVISGKILIYDCMDRNITLLLSDEAAMPIIIKAIHKTYTLSCIALPAEGIVKKVVDETHVTHYLSTSIAPAEYVTIVLNTTLIDQETESVKAVAYIGEPFYWYIWGPDNYKIKPLDCTTYSHGNEVVYSVDTHTDGCTLDGSFMSDFRRYNASDNLVVADVYAFRFPGSDQLRFYCNVLGCPSISQDACTLNCSSSERKRRSDDKGHCKTAKVMARLNGPTTYPPTSLGPVLPMGRQKRRFSQQRHGSVNAHLTVIGEPNVFPDFYVRGESSSLKVYSVVMVFTLGLQLTINILLL